MKTCRGISDLVIKTENGKEVLTNNDDEKAETLSKFFSSVFTNEGDGDIPRLNTHDIKEKLGRLIVTEENVLKRLRELNISKSPGPDNIHPRILHDLSEALCIPTTIIFNTSLATKTIPDDWSATWLLKFHPQMQGCNSGNRSTRTFSNSYPIFTNSYPMFTNSYLCTISTRSLYVL